MSKYRRGSHVSMSLPVSAGSLHSKTGKLPVVTDSKMLTEIRTLTLNVFRFFSKYKSKSLLLVYPIETNVK